MKIIDILLCLLIIVGAYAGYKKGLLVEILTFFAFIIAIISAFKLLHTGMSYISDVETNNKLLAFICFVVIFLVIFISIFLLAKFLKNTLDYTLVGKFDNWAGALMGACKMAFGISVLLWLMHYAKINLPKSQITDTFVYPQILPFAEGVVKVISYVIPFEDIFSTIKRAFQG